MSTIANIYVISGLIALIAGLFAYALFVPRNLDTFDPELGKKNESNKLLRFATLIGTELYASLPSGTELKKRGNSKVETLIINSGNPWNLNANEFVFLKFTMAFIGFIAGWAVWFLLSFATDIAWYIIVPITTLFGFMMPSLKYNDQAKKRDLEFKRQLPEALDLIIISLSGGLTFQQAVKSSLPNMQEGVLKEEFREIIANVDTGKTVNEALERFGNRAPNESIRTFVQAVREANELNVPLKEVLESRALESREEFFALIHAKTAALSSKMMAALAPTLIPALIIVLVVPFIASLIGSLGG